MLTKTITGTKIEILEQGDMFSKVRIIKNDRVMLDMANNTILWPELDNTKEQEKNIDYAAKAITKIFKSKNKKSCLNNKIKIDNQLLSDNEKKQFNNFKMELLKTENYYYVTDNPKVEKSCLNNKIKIDNNDILNSKRVAWLEKAYIIINDRLFNSLCPDMITISWSFPTRTVKKILGQSISSMVDNEHNYMIVINPTIADTLKVLQVLTHEMIHVHVGNEQKHGKEFTQFAKSIGFDKPYTKLNPNEKLNNELEKIIDTLGNIPSGHIELSDNKKKQTTRNKLWECSCGSKVRCAIKLNATCNDCNTLFIIQD